MGTETLLLTTEDGRRLCVESGGDPAGRPVVIHHGTPGSRFLLDEWTRDAAEDGVRLLCYDRPGYGDSSPQSGRVIADCVADVRTIAASLGYDRVAVWGISGGGPHALACAALLPDLVCAVASLAAIAPYGPPDLDYFTGMGQDNVDDIELLFRDREAARRKVASDREDVMAATAEQITAGFESLISPADAAALRDGLDEYLLRSMQVGLAPGDEGWWDDNVADFVDWGFDLGTIAVPVQLWHGRNDKFVPFQHGEWLARQIPGVDAQLTDSDGHLTLLSRLRAIHAWLLSHF
ncbi:MAG TPA: alpha/beta fold hydrolase [Acidimicrobiales bacterium]